MTHFWRPSQVLDFGLDGGGITGAFSAAVWAAWSRILAKAAADYFDLIVGTSTGGIIALGLRAPDSKPVSCPLE